MRMILASCGIRIGNLKMVSLGQRLKRAYLRKKRYVSGVKMVMCMRRTVMSVMVRGRIVVAFHAQTVMEPELAMKDVNSVKTAWRGFPVIIVPQWMLMSIIGISSTWSCVMHVVEQALLCLKVLDFHWYPNGGNARIVFQKDIEVGFFVRTVMVIR